MKTIKLIVVLVLFISCKDKSAKLDTASALENASSISALVLKMEGKTYTMEQEDLVPIIINFEENVFQYSIYTNRSPVQLNFILKDSTILRSGSKTYQIPECNRETIKVDLSFFNKNRNSSRINKQVVFKKGTIQIEEVTKHKLVMSFNGEGSGVTDSKNSFPITGSIQITY
tara:strand:- start:6 stop:521 length:516 start_codon:yes stop_codon:yes gene_type:complete